jgi:hypothetical protein
VAIEGSGQGSCQPPAQARSSFFSPASQTEWQEKGRGDADAYASYGVRSTGLTGTTTGVFSWAGDPAVAIYSGSIALIYTVLVCCAVFTALHTDNLDRRKTAVKVLKILTGVTVSKKGGGNS